MVTLSEYRPYHTNTVQGIVIDSDTVPILLQDFSVADLSSGEYKVALSLIFSTPDTNDYVDFIVDTTDVATPSTLIRTEAQDSDDIIPLTYVYPLVHLGGTYGVTVNGLLENGGRDATVRVSHIIIEKKGD